MRKFLLSISIAASLIMPVGASAAGVVGAPRLIEDQRQAFMTGSITVRGHGAGPADKQVTGAQRRLMTIRAATVDGYRRLAEAIEGVAISGETTVKEAALQSEAVTAAVQGVVIGAAVVSESYDASTDSAVVEVSVPVSGLAARVYPNLFTLQGVRPPQSYVPAPGALAAAGRGYDGLIVDAAGHPFRPALVNRVLAANGQALFDPASRAGLKGGAAGPGYTDDVAKAAALLAERGSRNPLVVRAVGVERSTDAVVGPEDAAAVFAADQAGNFLDASRVVFVIK